MLCRRYTVTVAVPGVAGAGAAFLVYRLEHESWEECDPLGAEILGPPSLSDLS
jgi:hypothetical protein